VADGVLLGVLVGVGLLLIVGVGVGVDIICYNYPMNVFFN
jgi:hypothetical protein